MKRIFVYGFPCLYGGAGTELMHQLVVWERMGLDIHLIPAWSVARHPLTPTLRARGIHVHEADDWEALTPEDPILCWCDVSFFSKLAFIRQKTKRTVFVNCMTWLYPQEKEAMRAGQVALFLYQNDAVRRDVMPELRALNGDPAIRFETFVPYFHHEDFPFVPERSSTFFGCGHISRQDADKFAADTLKIYEYFVAPVPKRGLFLGFDHRSEAKIGRPFDWIRTARDQHELSQQEFYRHCDIVLQPTDTVENWPRIGFESMASGSVLIVDNRGGWRQMIDHGRTGWLCDHERDFIYYASKMAYEPHMREDMAAAARERGLFLGGLERSQASWERVASVIDQLPL